MADRILSRWARLSVFNLMVLAAVGWILRYKIILPLPVVHQKHLLHAHSHFAFSGWVSQGLIVIILWIISRHSMTDVGRYRNFFRGSQLAAWGMLLTFPFFGYAWPSIAFSTTHILMSYLFSWKAWRDISQSDMPVGVMPWLKAALVFNVLSSLGTFFLAWMMSTGNHDQDMYIGAVYFYLHFQYNGWFLFALMGGWVYFLSTQQDVFSVTRDRWFFRVFLCAAFPGLFLSMLWMRLPAYIYAIAVIAALLSLLSAVLYIRWLASEGRWRTPGLQPAVRWLWGLASLALMLKLLMQALSAIPAVSPFAFGYRPIVVGYLHLVLLGFVSFGLLGGLIHAGLLNLRRRVSKVGISLFISGVVLNELLLMVQGIASIRYESVSGVPTLLFLMAGWMCTGVALLLIGQSRTNQNQSAG